MSDFGSIIANALAKTLAKTLFGYELGFEDGVRGTVENRPFSEENRKEYDRGWEAGQRAAISRNVYEVRKKLFRD